jgi:hypothetical protein
MIDPQNIVAKVVEKNRKVMPVYFPPLIHSYLNYSHQLAVILAYPETYDWFFSNYIQIGSSFLENNYLIMHFLPTDREAVESQLYLDISHLNEDCIGRKNNIVEMVKDWLNKDYYVGICLIESEIPGTILHEIGYHHPHTQFIYGYDLTRKHFNSINFNHEHNFSMLNIGFDTLKKACSSQRKQQLFQGEYRQWKNVRYPIKLFKFMGGCNYRFDIHDIDLQLREYCAGIAPDLKYRNWCVGEDHNYLKDKDTRWGLGVNDNLAKYFADIVEYRRNQPAGNPLNRLNPEYIPFHSFWEHKKVMTARLAYIQNKGFLDPSQKFPQRYYPVEHKANILRILVLKFLLKVNDSVNPRAAIPEQESLHLIEKVRSQLEELQQIEKTILEQVINELTMDHPSAAKCF